MKPNPNCRHCGGTGVRYVQNGPEDFDTEACEHTYSVDDLLAHLSTVTGLPL